MLGKQKGILAFDVGTTELRSALVRCFNGKWRTVHVGALPLPHGEGHKAKRSAAIRTGVKSACEKAGAPLPMVYVALPKNLVLTRVVETPKLPPKELRSVLALRVGSEVPFFDEESVVWDYETLPGFESSPQQRVAISAVRRSALEEFLGDFRAAGVEPAVLDVQPLAIMRWFMARRDSRIGADIAVIDLGEANAAISVVRKGLISRICQAPLPASELRQGNGNAQRYAREIETALRNPSDAADTSIPKDIVLCGDVDLADILGPAIREVLGSDVHAVGDCVKAAAGGPSIPPGQLDGNHHVLEGLLHRAQIKGVRLSNLAPGRSGRPLWMDLWERATQFKTLIPLTAILMLVFVVGSCQMREGRVAALDEAIAEIAPLRPQLEHLEETLNVLENYKTEQFSWLEILAELNEILPKEAMLTQLTMERSGKVMMQGTIGGETPAQKIEPFTTALKNSKFFAEAESGPIRRRKSDWSFSVACTLSSAKKGK